MLFPTDTALADALDESTRTPSFKILADWDNNGMFTDVYSDISPAVTEWNYERFGGNDLPEEVEMVQGYDVGSLDMTLAGKIAGIDVLTLFSAHNTASPFIGQDLVGTLFKFTMIVETTAGPREVPQFFGKLRAIEIDSKDRTVKLEILDLASALTAPITTPLGGVLREDIFKSYMSVHMRTQSVVDYVLRQNGIYATPPPKSDAILSATGHGWLSAEIGWNGISSALYANTIVTYRESRWSGMLASPGSWGTSALVLAQMGAHYHCTKRYDPVVVGTGMAAEGWFYIGATMVDASPAGFRVLYWIDPWADLNWRIYVTVNDVGLVRAYVTTPAAGIISTSIIDLQQTGAQSWRHVGVHVKTNTATSLTMTLRANGVTGTATFTVPTQPAAIEHPIVFLGLHRSWSNFQVWLTGTAPTAGNWPHELSANHVSQADIAEGNGRMTFVPEVIQGNSLDVLRSAVGSEYGKFGFDEVGRFKFTPYDPTAGFPVNLDRTVTAVHPLIDVSSERFLDSVRNIIGSEIRERHFNAYELEPMVEAVDPTDFESPTGVTSLFPVDVPLTWGSDGGLIQMDNIASDQWDQDSWGWHAIQKGSNVSQVSGVTVYWYQTSLRTGVIRVDNFSGFDIQFKLLSAQSGAPSLRVMGVPLKPTVETVFEAIDNPSITKFGRASFEIPPSEWRSEKTGYAGIAGDLLVQLKRPVTTLKQVPMLGDPRDQIGDVHLIRDPEGLGETYGLVQGIRRSFSIDSGYRQTIQYRVQVQEVQDARRFWSTVTPA